MNINVDDIIGRIDWTLRHIQSLRKQFPYTQKHVQLATYWFGRMYTYCDIIKVNQLELCKMVGIPYYSTSSDYSKLFLSKTPYDYSTEYLTKTPAKQHIEMIRFLYDKNN